MPEPLRRPGPRNGRRDRRPRRRGAHSARRRERRRVGGRDRRDGDERSVPRLQSTPLGVCGHRGPRPQVRVWLMINYYTEEWVDEVCRRLLEDKKFRTSARKLNG